MSRDAWAFVAIVCGLLIVYLGGWRLLPNWTTGHRRNITLVELEQLLPPEAIVEINRDPMKRMPGVQISIQCVDQDNSDSVIYHRAKVGENISETLDISTLWASGIIVSLVNNRVSTYEKIGGLTRKNPKISEEEQRSVEKLLQRMRSLADV